MKGVFFGDKDLALRHLSEVAIETVPKDVEAYMFTNMLTGADRQASKSEVVQQAL